MPDIRFAMHCKTTPSISVTTMNSDIFIYSHENLIEQVRNSPLELGYHRVQFYVDAPGIPAKQKTDSMEEFFLSPSGGTLRDSNMNIVIYSAKYDKYKGYGKA